MSWESAEIGSLCEVGRGSSPRPINNQAYFEGGDIAWIKIADATSSGKEIFETKEHVNAYGASFSRLLPIGSLILATSGVSLGQVKFLGIEGCIHDGWLYIKNYNGVVKEFLYYKLIELEKHFHSESYGAAIQNINTDILRRTKILLPPLETQKRIASILSNYDDLIENNLKRIKLLEETAQNIYKEWFVNFRFPNYEHTEFDSESGLPVGWEIKKIEDCIKIMKGKKPKKEYSTIGENRILYLLVDVLERRELRFTENESVQLASEGETLMLMDGSRSGLVFKSLEGAIGSTLAVFRIKNVVFGINYCFNYFKFREVEIISKNTGSAIPHANKSYIYGMDIPIPSDKISTEFETITSKIYQQIEILSSQNQKLKEARDILLPRLMNRTIEV